MPKAWRILPLVLAIVTSASCQQTTTTTRKDVVETTTTPEMAPVVSGNDTASSTTTPITPVWECPNITQATMECSCDFPHTLRCTGDRTALPAIRRHLRHHSRPGAISLLDVTVTGITILPARFLEDVALHGLVVSTGELRRVSENAFTALATPLQALGLPNNLLDAVPKAALSHLIGLERLDLSRNKLKTLEADSFKGLTNLTHLDLCDNLLSQLSPHAFATLSSLHTLKMRGNRLSVSALSALRGLDTLEELDLSSNLLIGPLGPNLLPSMGRLRYLTVAENEIVNVRQGALSELKSLTYLSLSHNQIDVLEDHCFQNLTTLTRLDLANNRIVAVSSASLAHLEKLKILDLTHNVLRSLTADLIVPLKSLEDLRLDDNDITMVSNEVPTSTLKLKRLSLADNPLNCDCTLLDFANWLANSNLSEEDKSSAVCATPPALENGILTQVSPGSLLCGDPTPPIATRVPLAGSQLTLKEFRYSRTTGIDLLWHVEPCAEHYMCDRLIVYETVGGSEVQIESSPLHCDSNVMRDPCLLPVAIPNTLRLQKGHEYRYCVVLLVPGIYDDVSLGLGCSDVIPLTETIDSNSILESNQSENHVETRITQVRVNVSELGFMHVDVALSKSDSSSASCQISIVVFNTESSTVVHRQELSCNLTIATLSVLLPGRYRVCASLDGPQDHDLNFSDLERSRCVDVQSFRQNTEAIIVVSIVVASCALLVAMAIVGRSIVKKLRSPQQIRTQCFLPAQEFEITHKAHYIKLLATTKV